MKTSLTPYQQHVENWKNCKKCDLWKRRNKVVLYRGRIPCDMLFIGEAPGANENTTGSPFVGPSGQLLSQIVHNATCHLKNQANLRVGYTNLIGCIPWDETGIKKVKEPPLEAVQACSSRIEEIANLANPRIIIFVGVIAEAWLDPRYVTTVEMPGGVVYDRITHPGHMVRQDITQRGLLAQEAEVTIREVLDTLLRKENFLEG